VEFAREDVLDLWQQLRTYGFLAGEDIPASYAPVAVPLLELLERLPYVDRTEFITWNELRADKQATVTAGLERPSSRGVRLVPWTSDQLAPEQLTLFDRLSVA
jgi:hypothetical protein